jgi:hypothetical protein
VKPCHFRYGDGTWAYLPGEAVYGDRHSAKRAWQTCRREVWVMTHRFSLPTAAVEYDGLSRDGSELLSRTWQHVGGLPLAEVLDALARDRKSVRAFEVRDPQGAQAIGDLLALWRADLDAIEREARRIAARGADGWHGGAPAIGANETYGGAGTGQTDLRTGLAGGNRHG